MFTAEKDENGNGLLCFLRCHIGLAILVQFYWYACYFYLFPYYEVELKVKIVG